MQQENQAREGAGLFGPGKRGVRTKKGSAMKSCKTGGPAGRCWSRGLLSTGVVMRSCRKEPGLELGAMG